MTLVCVSVVVCDVGFKSVDCAMARIDSDKFALCGAEAEGACCRASSGDVRDAFTSEVASALAGAVAESSRELFMFTANWLPFGSIVERCVSELFDRVAVAQPVFEVTVSNGQIRCKRQRCEKSPHNDDGASATCRRSCDPFAGGWSTRLEYRIVRLTTRG